VAHVTALGGQACRAPDPAQQRPDSRLGQNTVEAELPERSRRVHHCMALLRSWRHHRPGRGVSRVLLSVHYPSDVPVGAAIGVGASAVVESAAPETPLHSSAR